MKRATSLYLEKEAFKSFLNTCRDLDSSGSKEVRQFIRRFNENSQKVRDFLHRF